MVKRNQEGRSEKMQSVSAYINYDNYNKQTQYSCYTSSDFSGVNVKVSGGASQPSVVIRESGRLPVRLPKVYHPKQILTTLGCPRTLCRAFSSEVMVMCGYFRLSMIFTIHCRIQQLQFRLN